MEEVRAKLIEVRAQLDQAIAMLSEEPKFPPESQATWGTIRPICWGARVSEDFRASIFWIEQELKLNADNLMAVMGFETGLTFSPSIKNPRSSATGLIQFMRRTAEQLGTTTEALARMSAVRQLSYVYHYFKQFGNNLSAWNLADTYMAVLLPNMIGKPLEAEMDWSQAAYEVNKGLDADKSGEVTKGEATRKVEATKLMGLKKENMA